MNLTTNYLGLTLDNPIVPSSSPLMREIDLLKRMEDEGAAAVVLHSLFEEEINQESHTLDQYLTQGTHSYAEAISYFPEAPSYKVGPETYLEHVRRAKTALDIPVIGSLNGVSTGGWVQYAQAIQQAGADALELNVYYLPTDLDLTAVEVERMYMDLLRDVKAAVSIPVAVKLSPFFSATANMAKKLSEGGADGLVLFNRFYQPDLDLEQLSVDPNLRLSTSDELRLPLRWIAILHGRIAADLALTSGVHEVEDVLKGVAAGAAITMVASELLRNGIARISELRRGVERWLMENEYESLEQLQGSLSQINCPEPAAFERANYRKVLDSYRPEWVAWATL